MCEERERERERARAPRRRFFAGGGVRVGEGERGGVDVVGLQLARGGSVRLSVQKPQYRVRIFRWCSREPRDLCQSLEPSIFPNRTRNVPEFQVQNETSISMLWFGGGGQVRLERGPERRDERVRGLLVGLGGRVGSRLVGTRLVPRRIDPDALVHSVRDGLVLRRDHGLLPPVRLGLLPGTNGPVRVPRVPRGHEPARARHRGGVRTTVAICNSTLLAFESG